VLSESEYDEIIVEAENWADEVVKDVLGEYMRPRRKPDAVSNADQRSSEQAGGLHPTAAQADVQHGLGPEGDNAGTGQGQPVQ
jgi:hypothetical protein